MHTVPGETAKPASMTMPSYAFNKKRNRSHQTARRKHRQAPPFCGARQAAGSHGRKKHPPKSSSHGRGNKVCHGGTSINRRAPARRFFAKYIALLLLVLATPLSHDIARKEDLREAPRILESSQHDLVPSAPVPKQYLPSQPNGLNSSAQRFRSETSTRLVSTEIMAIPQNARAGERQQQTPLRLLPGSPDWALGLHRPEAIAKSRQPLHWQRLALVQTLTLGLGGYGFQHYNNLFGHIGQPFKIGNDWNNDHTLHFDELLHFQGGYRITQAVSAVYRWAGVSPQASDWIGFGTSALIMTSLEYIDGRRKNDQASYSDLAANFLGMGFALARARYSWLQNFDLRLSYRTLADPFRRSTVKRYDRITHWLTYDLNRAWRIPLHVGLGYSLVNAHRPGVQAQYYFGVGISPSAVLERFSPSAAKTLAWLDFYHFGNQVQLNEVSAAAKNGKRKS